MGCNVFRYDDAGMEDIDICKLMGCWRDHMTWDVLFFGPDMLEPQNGLISTDPFCRNAMHLL